MLWNAESPWGTYRTPGLCFLKIKFVGSHTKSTESVRIFRQHVPRAGANFKRPAATGLMALELENILNLNLTLFSELSFQFGLLLRPLECVHHISKSVKRIYTDVLCMRPYYSNAQSSWRHNSKAVSRGFLLHFTERVQGCTEAFIKSDANNRISVSSINTYQSIHYHLGFWISRLRKPSTIIKGNLEYLIKLRRILIEAAEVRATS